MAFTIYNPNNIGPYVCLGTPLYPLATYMGLHNLEDPK